MKKSRVKLGFFVDSHCFYPFLILGCFLGVLLPLLLLLLLLPGEGLVPDVPGVVIL